MHWILQNNIYSEEGYKSLVETLQKFNIPHSVHKCIPFVGKLDPEPQPTQDKVIVMGSYTLAKEAMSRGWTPGVFLNENFNFCIQRQHWGKYMFNADATVTTINNVSYQEEPFFIRPIGDNKEFVGQVMDWIEFCEWKYRLLSLTKEDNPTVTKDTPILVGECKPIYDEYRTWIVDGNAVAWSQYKLGTLKHYQSNVGQQVIDFARKMANIWSPHRAFVLDVFSTPNGLKIGEVNCLNASGFYSADMERLVLSLEKAFN